MRSRISRGNPGAGSTRCESAMEGKDVDVDVAVAEAERFEMVDLVSSSGSCSLSCPICDDDFCIFVLSRSDFLRHLFAVRRQNEVRPIFAHSGGFEVRSLRHTPTSGQHGGTRRKAEEMFFSASLKSDALYRHLNCPCNTSGMPARQPDLKR